MPIPSETILPETVVFTKRITYGKTFSCDVSFSTANNEDWVLKGVGRNEVPTVARVVFNGVQIQLTRANNPPAIVISSDPQRKYPSFRRSPNYTTD